MSKKIADRSADVIEYAKRKIEAKDTNKDLYAELLRLQNLSVNNAEMSKADRGRLRKLVNFTESSQRAERALDRAKEAQKIAEKQEASKRRKLTQRQAFLIGGAILALDAEDRKKLIGNAILALDAENRKKSLKDLIRVGLLEEQDCEILGIHHEFLQIRSEV